MKPLLYSSVLEDVETGEHPDFDMLLLLAMNRLAGRDRTAAEEHLSLCDRCRHDLTDIDRYLAATGRMRRLQ